MAWRGDAGYLLRPSVTLPYLLSLAAMRLSVKNLGPIAEADVTFGDLTILVGPQATGKSIFLQTLKLVRDDEHIQKLFGVHGYNFTSGEFVKDYVSAFYGEGTANYFSTATTLALDDQPIHLRAVELADDALVSVWDEEVFYVPAQRVLVMQDGWPLPFQNVWSSAPYCLKAFGDQLRRMLDSSEFVFGQEILPIKRVSRPGLYSLMEAVIYPDSTIRVEKELRKRVVLQRGEIVLPLLSWSAGQREFLPVILTVRNLTARKKAGGGLGAYNTVIIEEPEMGLHPKAIQFFLLLVLDLLNVGHKVILSTHSPVVLEMAWALSRFKKAGAGPAQVARLFDVPMSADLEPLFASGVAADVKVYYFNRGADGRVRSEDISALDPAAADPGEAEWGGLAEFATRATDLVTEIMAEYWSTHPHPADE